MKGTMNENQTPLAEPQRENCEVEAAVLCLFVCVCVLG